MEESKATPEEDNSIKPSAEFKEEANKEENIKAFTEFLEKASNQEVSDDKIIVDSKDQEVVINKNSFFQRILNDGFDGISSNPNYKMLALLIILLINLSLFFVIGNIGKAFLRNSGIMG